MPEVPQGFQLFRLPGRSVRAVLARNLEADLDAHQGRSPLSSSYAGLDSPPQDSVSQFARRKIDRRGRAVLAIDCRRGLHPRNIHSSDFSCGARSILGYIRVRSKGDRVMKEPVVSKQRGTAAVSKGAGAL